MAGTFNYRFKEKYQVQSCVVKYWFGTRYFIWKALDLKKSCEQVFKDLNTKISKGVPNTDLFSKVIRYQKQSRCVIATVEVLLASDDFDEILEFDRQELAHCAGDPNCLNLNSEPYIPKWLQTATENKALQSTILKNESTNTTQDVKSQQRPKELHQQSNMTSVSLSDSELKAKIEKMRAIKQKISGGK